MQQRGRTPERLDNGSLQRDWVGIVFVDISKDTSPELAIKIAYDFGRGLRSDGAPGEEFTDLVQEWVESRFADDRLLPYIRAGFRAGFYFAPLPWRRQIESEQ